MDEHRAPIGMSEAAVTASIISMRGIGKHFSGVRVLNNVDFDLREGEVHALVGGNGAGKTTLMKILEGVYAPDEGEIVIGGKAVRMQSAHDARALGIAMIFQEFSLVPALTVSQNIFLTREARDRFGLISDRECERRADQLFGELGVVVDARSSVSSLSTGHKQLTEIAKALSQDAHTLIMDEPTASLTQNETDALFRLIRKLKSKGVAIIYISHRMEEILSIADRVTVLRDGQVVATEERQDLTLGRIIEHIVGRKMEGSFEAHPHSIDRSGVPVLELSGVRSGDRVRDVRLRLYRGEVLGLVGLMGSGRTELLQTIFGMYPMSAGQIKVRGNPVTIRNPMQAMAAGIALIPEDRRVQGLVMDHTLKDNFLLPLLKQFTKRGLIDDGAAEQKVRDGIKGFGIVTDSIFKPVRLLSGGNQQKVVIGKWLGSEPEILLMDEPTAGVDIGAKTEIMAVIRRLARELRKAIIVVSSELPELLAVSDRVAVLKNGTVVRDLERTAISSEAELHHLIQGNEL